MSNKELVLRHCLEAATVTLVRTLPTGKRMRLLAEGVEAPQLVWDDAARPPRV